MYIYINFKGEEIPTRIEISCEYQDSNFAFSYVYASNTKTRPRPRHVNVTSLAIAVSLDKVCRIS